MSYAKVIIKRRKKIEGVKKKGDKCPRDKKMSTQILTSLRKK